MSILVNALTDHKVPDHRDDTFVIERLSSTAPALEHVGDYWRRNLPVYNETSPVWTKVEDHTYFAYHGPGGFAVEFGERVAVIVSLHCRYNAFTTTPELQAILLPAFKSISLALGGTQLVVMPDDDGPCGDAAMYSGASLDGCIDLIRKVWGEPRSPIEVTTKDFEAQNRRESPVWYVEALKSTV